MQVDEPSTKTNARTISLPIDSSKQSAPTEPKVDPQKKQQAPVSKIADWRRSSRNKVSCRFQNSKVTTMTANTTSKKNIQRNSEVKD